MLKVVRQIIIWRIAGLVIKLLRAMLHFQYATFNIQHKHELPLAGVLLNTDALKMATQWAGHSVT